MSVLVELHNTGDATNRSAGVVDYRDRLILLEQRSLLGNNHLWASPSAPRTLECLSEDQDRIGVQGRVD